MGSSRLFYTIRAKNTGEQLAHRITRLAFDGHVIFDRRTRNLFASWGEQYGLDAAVNELAGVLDDIVTVSGLPNRLAVQTAPGSIDDGLIQRRVLRLDQRIWQLVADSREARAREMILFVSTLLNASPPGPPHPISSWLELDLMTVFEMELAGHVWDTKIPLDAPLAPTLTHVIPKGQRPKHDGEHLVRNASWYWRAKYQEERVSEAQLAAEYRAQRAREGISLASKSHDDPRADTSTVRDGIKEAQRLLELPVPPWKWPGNDILAALKVKGGKH